MSRQGVLAERRGLEPPVSLLCEPHLPRNASRARRGEGPLLAANREPFSIARHRPQRDRQRNPNGVDSPSEMRRIEEQVKLVASPRNQHWFTATQTTSAVAHSGAAALCCPADGRARHRHYPRCA
jgi:hypothetical protein